MSARRDVPLAVHRSIAVACCVAAFLAYSQPNWVESDECVAIVAERSRDLRQITWQTVEGILEVRLPTDTDGGQVLFTPQPARIYRPASAGAGTGTTTEAGTAAGPSVSAGTARAPASPQAARLTADAEAQRRLGALQTPYPANAQAKALAERLAQLRAVRQLGTLSPAQAQGLQLAPAATTLTLDFGARGLRRLRVGSSAYGTGELVVQDEHGTAYVLRQGTFAALGGGGVALQDRDLVGLGRADVQSLTVSRATTRRAFAQRYPKERFRAFFAERQAPTEPVPEATQLVEEILRLQVAPGALQPAATDDVIHVALAPDEGEPVALRLFCTTQQPWAESSRLAGAAALTGTPICALATKLLAPPAAPAPGPAPKAKVSDAP